MVEKILLETSWVRKGSVAKSDACSFSTASLWFLSFKNNYNIAAKFIGLRRTLLEFHMETE